MTLPAVIMLRAATLMWTRRIFPGSGMDHLCSEERVHAGDFIDVNQSTTHVDAQWSVAFELHPDDDSVQQCNEMHSSLRLEVS
jgi:hypothetical protein